MILSMDNFEIYAIPDKSVNLDVSLLAGRYLVEQSSEEGLAIYKSDEGRVVIGNAKALTGRRSVIQPVGEMLIEHKRLNVVQKLVNFTPTDVSIGAICTIGSNSSEILQFGFDTNKRGFVRYVDEGGVVREDSFILSTSLSGVADTIEWSFEKTQNSSDHYGAFTLWVNNKPAYVDNVFNQIGSASSIGIRVMGGVGSLAVGSKPSTPHVSSNDNVTVPLYGTTDLVLTSGERLGQVRVNSRLPSADIGPNSMTSTKPGVGHWSVVGSIPATADDYLTATSAAAQEMYGAGVYPEMANEAVLAVGLTYVAQKNNPYALDLVGMIRLDSKTHETETIPVDLTRSVTSVVLDRNPWTGLAWTPLEANSMSFGMKVN